MVRIILSVKRIYMLAMERFLIRNWNIPVILEK